MTTVRGSRMFGCYWSALVVVVLLVVSQVCASPLQAPTEDNPGVQHENTAKSSKDIVVLRPWEPSYSNQSSPEYTRLAEELRSMLRSVEGDVQVMIMRQSDQGNIIVTVTIMHKAYTNQEAMGALEVMEKAINTGSLDDIPVQYQSTTCKTNEFECNNGSCIPMNRRCNKVIDCPDRSDELNCPQNCSTNEFQCNNGNCIPKSRRCNQVKDCLDGSDELKCRPQSCGSGMWQCNDRTCIADPYVCDGYNDCPDNSDEASYTCRQPTRCDRDQWTCGNGFCIPDYHFCDGHYDCTDRTDEQNCPTIRCDRDQWTCGNGFCIPDYHFCDGHYDCTDRTDEQNCPTIISAWWCCLNGQYIPFHQRCDGYCQCADSSDELNCGTWLG